MRVSDYSHAFFMVKIIGDVDEQRGTYNITNF